MEGRECSPHRLQAPHALPTGRNGPEDAAQARPLQPAPSLRPHLKGMLPKMNA